MASVQESQGFERGDQHLQQFVWVQSAPAQDLRERLVGIFHDDKDKLLFLKPIASRLEQLNQVGMIERGRPGPLLQQRVRLPTHRPRTNLIAASGRLFALCSVRNTAPRC